MSVFLRDHTVALNIASLAVVGLLLIVQIIQVNAATTKGYQMRELENQISELSLLQQNLQLESRKVQSLDHVSRSIKMLGFIESDMPTYLSSSTPSVAMAQ
ncbi:MAG: hypothetical protein WC654_06905 [Patescibacteria group bacterium]